MNEHLTQGKHFILIILEVKTTILSSMSPTITLPYYFWVKNEYTLTVSCYAGHTGGENRLAFLYFSDKYTTELLINAISVPYGTKAYRAKKVYDPSSLGLQYCSSWLPKRIIIVKKKIFSVSLYIHFFIILQKMKKIALPSVVAPDITLQLRYLPAGSVGN